MQSLAEFFRDDISEQGCYPDTARWNRLVEIHADDDDQPHHNYCYRKILVHTYVCHEISPAREQSD
jgi:hypothetical protein